MGEIAEMMLDGTLCECCGAYIGDGDGDGFSRYCSAACAKGRGVDLASSDEDRIAWLNDLDEDERDDPVTDLRLFMGVGKKRAKRLVARWRADLAKAAS